MLLCAGQGIVPEAFGASRFGVVMPVDKLLDEFPGAGHFCPELFALNNWFFRRPTKLLHIRERSDIGDQVQTVLLFLKLGRHIAVGFFVIQKID